MEREPLQVSASGLGSHAYHSSPEINFSRSDDETGGRNLNSAIGTEQTSYVSTPFLYDTPASTRTAEWGIHWLSEPLQLPLFTSIGVALAVAHHYLYRALDGLIVSETKFGQQAVKQIGNVFVFLVLAFLKSAIEESYNQYIWTVFRRRSLAVSTLDKLFLLPFKIASFCSLRLLGEAKIAAVLGMVSWLLFIGGLTPAATLSVVPDLQNATMDGPVPVLDFNKVSWWQLQTLNTDTTLDPTAAVLKTATAAAFAGSVIPPIGPSLNSSFGVQFYGPTIQCRDPDINQTRALNQIAKAFQDRYHIVTVDYDFADPGEGPFGYLVMTSFGPTQNAVDEPYYREDIIKAYNNWVPDLPREYLSPTAAVFQQSQQLWVLTADHGIVCSLVNASFHVGFKFEGGVGQVSYQDVTILPPVPPRNTTALSIIYNDVQVGGGISEDATKMKSAYYAYSLALGSLIYGNISLESNIQTCPPYCNGVLRLSQASSRILQTGLVACDEIVDNYWFKTNRINNTGFFSSQPWMCRNKTLARGLEDLANNITISMLSIGNLTTNVTAPVTVITLNNIYSYDMRNLLISYSATILVTLICVVVGVVSLLKNGIYHTTSFSTVLATTRNPDLDALCEGACLGTGKEMMDERLMYGVLVGANARKERGGEQLNGKDNGILMHAGFGLDGSVVKIRKGMRCS